MSVVTVRLARPTDASAIDAAGYEGALHHMRLAPTGLLAEPSPDSHEWSEGVISSSHESVCFVAELDDKVVGYVHAVVVQESRPMFTAHRYGRVDAVAVIPRFRARGIASALLDEAEQWLAKNGCKCARLSVFTANTVAAELHAGRGYKPLVMFMEKAIKQRDEEPNPTFQRTATPPLN